MSEFKLALVDPSRRVHLGVDLSDSEVMQTLADDQKLSYLYIAWRNGLQVIADPIAGPESSGELIGVSPEVRRRRQLIIFASLGGVAVIIIGVVVAVHLSYQFRLQSFVENLNNDSTLQIATSEVNEQSRATFDATCDKYADGWTEADVLAAAQNNWAAVVNPDITYAQWVANNIGIYRAAEGLC